MAAWLPYLVAIAATLAAALWRLILGRWLGSDLPYLTFYGAIMAAAWYGGLRPGLLATALSAAITAGFFLAPRIEVDGLKPVHVVGIVIFVGTGWLISAGADALRRTREGHRLEAERLRTTLQSIGDGVIVTDAGARIVSQNAVAERLTGWSSDDAAGRALDEIFRIVHEDTRQPVDNPAGRALREGVIVGLANHHPDRPRRLRVADRRQRRAGAPRRWPRRRQRAGVPRRLRAAPHRAVAPKQ
jgi:PAS domain S-box-containing protein